MWVTQSQSTPPAPLHRVLSSTTYHPPGPELRAYELMICPDQVSCFVPGLRCVIFTSTACTFRFLGGTRHTLYVTSSPSTGTYSPSMLNQRKIRMSSCVSSDLRDDLKQWISSLVCDKFFRQQSGEELTLTLNLAFMWFNFIKYLPALLQLVHYHS